MENSVRLCPRCGTQDRYQSGRCKQCQKIASKKWDLANPGRSKAYSAAWNKKNFSRAKVRMAAWIKANPARKLFLNTRASARKGSYTPMTIEDCEKAVANRPELCEACHDRPATNCDHDHTTGVFRGWLCRGCNLSDGYLGTLERIEALAAYIRKHKPQ